MRTRFSGHRRLIVTTAAVGAGLIALVIYLASNPAVAMEGECGDGRAPCPNVACVSACWADGTYHNPHTKVKNTPFAPIECEPGGGCLTQACN